MLDLVLAGNLPKLEGIDAFVPASALHNFRETKTASSKGEARAKGVLLYSASYEFDDGAYLELRRNGGALVFSFSDVLCEKGFRRAIVLSKMRLALAACRKAGCGFVFCTLAKNGEGCRNARELVAFASVLGMTQEERKYSKELLEKLAGAAVEGRGTHEPPGLADAEKCSSFRERGTPSNRASQKGEAR